VEPLTRVSVQLPELEVWLDRYRAAPDYSEGLMLQRYIEYQKATVWGNRIYQVIRYTQSREMNPSNLKGFLWLSIRRHDGMIMVNWAEAQQIKNQLAGPEVEMVQIFPAESRLVDMENQYHLWTHDRLQKQLKFGFNSREVRRRL